MLDVMSKAIHDAIQSEGISYPDQRALGHLLESLSGLSEDAKGRVEKCASIEEDTKESGPGGKRSVGLSASGQLSGGSRGGR